MKASSQIQECLSEAWSKRRVGDYEAAKSLIAQAEEICASDDYASLGRIYHIYMQFEADHDRHEQALPFSKQSIAFYEKAQMPNKLAHAIRHLADLHQILGRSETSEIHYRKALSIYRSDPGTAEGNLANALRGFGLLLEKIGKDTEAISIWQETKALYLACGLKAGVEEAQQHLNELL